MDAPLDNPPPPENPQQPLVPQPPEYTQPGTVIRPVSAETEGAGTTALWLEIIFGFFALLGMGHVYSGRTLLGIALMVGWWIYIAVAGFLSTITLGFGACLFVPLYIAIPIISGIQARTYVHKTEAKGHWTPVALVAGGGCLLIILAIGTLAGLGIIAAILSNNNYR
jgi:hypothetical protein